MAKYRRVPVNELFVDDDYQRPLDAARANAIASNYDETLFGTLEVSQRDEGEYAVFDGQHRLEALRLSGAKDAPCLVHSGLSPADEALLFVRLQTLRKALSPMQRFKARLYAGEPVAMQIDEVCRERGYLVTTDGAPPYAIGAVTALDRVYALGGRDLLERTMDVIHVWQDEPKSTDGALIQGVAVCLDRYDGDDRLNNLPAALEKITAQSVLRKAIALTESGGGSGSRPMAVAKVVARLVGIRGKYAARKAVANA